VANKVVVTSKSNDDEQHVWTSTADAKFFVVKDPRGDTLGRGTRVTLHLKDDAAEYLEQDKIKNLIKKYSEFINFDIYLYTSKVVEEEVEVEETESEASEEESSEEAAVEDEEAKEETETKTEKVSKTVWDWELINANKPILLRQRAKRRGVSKPILRVETL